MGLKSLVVLCVLSCALGALVFSDDVDTKVAESPIIVKVKTGMVKNTKELSNLTSAEALDLLHKIAMNQTTPNSKPMIITQTEIPMKTKNNSTVGPTKPPGPLNPNESGRMRCQDPKNMLFIETARACKDERGPKICEDIFEAPDEQTGRRDPKCDQAGFEDIAKSCRNRCAICCEDLNYSCENDKSGLVNCESNKDKCNNPKFFETLSKYCGGTCGLCQKTACRDNNADCRSMKPICLNPKHQDTMKQQCARTCGFCKVEGVGPAPAPGPVYPPTTVPPSTDCVDLAKNCGGRLNLCKHPVYIDYMTKYCRKTCGQCHTEVVTNPTCFDNNPRCAAWAAKGFCTNSYYTVDYRKQNCAKTCGFC